MNGERDNLPGTAQGRSLLTVGDVADLLKISVRGVWRLVGKGEFPKPMHIGRLARWKTETYEAWLDQRKA